MRKPDRVITGGKPLSTSVKARTTTQLGSILSSSVYLGLLVVFGYHGPFETLETSNAANYPMNISFLKDDPLNTVIVDSSDERQLYDVQTPSKTCNRTTTIRRFKPGVTSDEGEIIAEVQWRKLGSSMITLHGSTVPLKDWLKKDRMFSSSRTFTASDGNQYKWSLGSGKFTLKDTNTNAEAAQSHRSKTGGTPTMKMNIDIFPQGMHFRDNIVVSFIIMEEKDRQAKARAATVIIIGNGNTLGTSS